jgi:signal transduction histidine kinase
MLSLTTSLWAAVAALAVATAALLSNPRREINRILAGVAVWAALWLAGLHLAIIRPNDSIALRIPWLISSLAPIALVLVRLTMLQPGLELVDKLKAARAWWAVPLVVSALVLSPWFLQASGGLLRAGAGFYGMIALSVLAQLLLAILTVRKSWREVGILRLELQLLVMGGVGSVCAALLLWGIGSATGDVTYLRLMPLAFIGLFGGMCWSLLTTRVLDARHILTLGIEKSVLVAGVTVVVWGIQQIAGQFFPDWLSFPLSIAIGLWFTTEVRPWIQEASQRKAAAEKARGAAIEIARRDLRPEQMEDAFLHLLTRWADCERAVIMMASPGRLVGGGLEWSLDRPELKLLHGLRWVTPERLERERPREYGPQLAKLLRDEQLGCVVASGGPSLAFVIGLGRTRSAQPYTFPKIGQLLGLESIIESSLSRAHYLMKSQHAEKLATVGLLGASIAHEIRNPLVSIKTFVQLLPLHYQDPVFREKFFRLIGDEVGRIDRLTEQLLDLSAPRVFSSQQTALHALLLTCVELVSAKAEDKRVAIVTELQAQADVVYTDPSAVKQVVLNLCFNAIQALENRNEERILRICTNQVADNVEVTIEDNGPGIAPEVWARLFQPFQSTKSSGFGLGLAICKDILSSLHASITADPPQPGRGATFRIILPCQPPTS